MNMRHVVEHFPARILPLLSPPRLFRWLFSSSPPFYFRAAVIFLGLLNYVSAGRRSRLLLLEYNE